ncbi:hypothetical protein FKW50_06885 [Acetobacter pomorum]|uniref:hypothetical protein n=1 Tax=Acetobacter pomorum TaxID=65959 RepID=UPI001289B298|nr:hypothetical protein [Acetobacter pomorum]KAA8419958.1 hypothetical protein FKW54_14395 [Acetobacter pomorum]KAA8435540.1 hypothetical protein FKW50_06885 [Acetobacter pomorum]KAA8448327.1 hypothetical protein FKW52_13570 [Acetobacter pomorum]
MEIKVGERVTAPAKQLPEVTGTVSEIHKLAGIPVAVIESDEGERAVVVAGRLISLKPIEPLRPPEESMSYTHFLRDAVGQFWAFSWNPWTEKWMTFDRELTPQKMAALGFVYDSEIQEPEEKNQCPNAT